MLARWMKEHQIWTAVVAAVLGVVGTVGIAYWNKEVKQVAFVLTEGGLLNDDVASKLGKKIEIRMDGVELKNPRSATVWFTNTGTGTLEALQFVFTKTRNGKFVAWTVASESSVIRNESKAETNDDCLKLRVPFMNAGDSVAVHLLREEPYSTDRLRVECGSPGVKLISGSEPSAKSAFPWGFLSLFAGGILVASVMIGVAVAEIMEKLDRLDGRSGRRTRGVEGEQESPNTGVANSHQLDSSSNGPGPQ